ncbi:hypothetical protein SDC9_152582 [bioreactor metagenome]|uniref:Uncharacterized protein n=1 Tax=bioreactor metagenome TaxID=1076179 RepID=A0A645EVS8_9ZZZZ
MDNERSYAFFAVFNLKNDRLILYYLMKPIGAFYLCIINQLKLKNDETECISVFCTGSTYSLKSVRNRKRKTVWRGIE